MRQLFLPVFLLLLLPLIVEAQADRLQEELAAFAGNYRAQIGIAVIIDHMDTVLVNNRADYPLLSVFKFHQALAVINHLHRKGISLDEQIHIRRKELLPDTYSPLRDSFPEGDVTLPVRELLRYTMQQSDNNACDILFRRFGGVRATERYIRSLGMNDVVIRYNEEQMHRNIMRCYANCTSPLDAVGLIEYVRTHELPEQEYLEYIFSLMETCATGSDRLAAPLLHTQVVFGHKTGTGDRNAQGLLIAVNDIGYVWRLPNFHSYSIAVFVKDSSESPEATVAIVAGISERVYRFVNALPSLSM